MMYVDIMCLEFIGYLNGRILYYLENKSLISCKHL